MLGVLTSPRLEKGLVFSTGVTWWVVGDRHDNLGHGVNEIGLKDAFVSVRERRCKASWDLPVIQYSYVPILVCFLSKSQQKSLSVLLD